jgi:ABC-type multidrug transport system ATPase subunit
MSVLDSVVLERVRKRFERREVLREVNWRVPAGSTTALFGRNGAGKTTLIRMLLGVLPCDGGRLSVLGLDPARKPRAVKARVGHVSESMPFHPRWRVEDALDLVQSIRGRAWQPRLARELMEAFQLPGRARIHHLSRGQRIQLGLVLALGHRPELVLLDEPVAGLDPVVQRDVLASLVDAVHRDGRTIVLASHRLDDVERLADRVAFLHQGRMVLEGPLDALRQEARRLAVRPAAPPEFFVDLPGRPFVKREGDRAVLTYLEGAREAETALRASGRFEEVEVERLNLETLYLDVLGEPRVEEVCA